MNINLFYTDCIIYINNLKEEQINIQIEQILNIIQSVENHHEVNIQGGARMTLPPGAVKVPAAPGDYVLSFRWDCEQQGH